MRIDTLNKRILYELVCDARISESALAKRLKKSRDVIRYRINQLEKEKYIQGYTIWIDPVSLGYVSGKIYLTLANKPEEKKRFRDFINGHPNIFWFGIAEGSWNAGLTFFVDSNENFFDIKNNIFTKFKDLILESKTAVLVSVNYKQPNYLYNSRANWSTLFLKRTPYELDELERKLLSYLLDNGREQLVILAKKCNSTVDVVRTRLRRLIKNKVISRFTTVINTNRLGFDFYKSFLYFRNLSKKDEMRLFEYARVQPNILHLVKQISPWDIELEIMSESYTKYNQIIADLTKEFANCIHKVETAIMYEDYIFPARSKIFN